MNKKTLIINPWITDFKLYDEWMHPTGIYLLMSLLKHNNWDVEYINCLERGADSKMKKHNTGTFQSTEIPTPDLYDNIHRKYKRYGISKSTFIDKLKNYEKPDVIFIGSFMTYWFLGLAETIEETKLYFPEVPIIIGGISATLIPEIIENRFSDVIVFPGQLMDNIKLFSSLHPILHSITDKKWQPSLIEAFKTIKNHVHGPVLAAIGCPLRCAYCASSLLQKKYFFRPISTIINEIKYCIDHFGVTNFAFCDDALLYQPEKYFLPLAKEIARLDSSIQLHAPNGLHIRWLTRQVLVAMQSCGFITLRFGFEAGSIKYKKETNAKTTRKEVAEKIKLITDSGFKSRDIGVYVMGGLPDQTRDDMLEDIDFIGSLGAKVKPVFLSPVPGTKLFIHYIRDFPELETDPLFHNDTFFITQLPGWNFSIVDEVKKVARNYN